MILAAAAVFAVSLLMKVLPEDLHFVAIGVGALAIAFLFLGKSMATGVIGAVVTLIALFGTSINPLFVNVFSFMAVGVLALAAAFAVLNYSGGSLALGLFVALSGS